MAQNNEQIALFITQNRASIIKITFSSPTSPEVEFKKLILRPITLKGKSFWQAEQFKDNKVFHHNISDESALDVITDIIPDYGQIRVFEGGNTTTYSITKGKNYRASTASNSLKISTSAQQNDRQKEYLLKEGEDIPALVDLGVFTKDFKIVNSKYDKYKQINRFVELIDHAYSQFGKDNITILDFGCGKSYLTFIVYYYFTKVKNVKAKIIGYDLKADVVEDCNNIAKKYGYDDLEFVVADVTKDVLYNENIDMVISLHACDTATDYALYYAIKKGVKSIFSVPCCQHEVNSSIREGGEFDVFLRYGIVKERMCALLTDTVRAMIIEDMGYNVDMIEFVDLSHSPKNIMLRAKKTGKENYKNKEKLREMISQYSIKQTLFELVYGEKQ